MSANSQNSSEIKQWNNFKTEFWKNFNRHWIDVENSKHPEVSYSIYYERNQGIEILFMHEEHSDSHIISTDLTDFGNKIDIDIRKHGDNKTIFIYHIADVELEEKRRIEKDVYINSRFGFDKELKAFAVSSGYIELEDRYIKWKDDKSEYEVLIKGTPDVIKILINKEKPSPTLDISEYADYTMTYPIKLAKDSGNPRSTFSIAHADLVGKWKLGDKIMELGSYGYCKNCGGDFWWADKSESSYKIQIFDLNTSKTDPVKSFNATIEGESLKDTDNKLVYTKAN
jgi:hypothetical protein